MSKPPIKITSGMSQDQIDRLKSIIYEQLKPSKGKNWKCFLIGTPKKKNDIAICEK